MFLLSKIATELGQPANLALIALVLGSLLLFGRRKRLGRGLILAATMLLLCIAILPWGAWLIVPLENRFPPPAMPEQVDGIISLGGAVETTVSEARGQPSLNSAAERLTALAELRRRHPQARMIFSGGSGSVSHPDLKEAPVARAFLERMGVDCSQMIFEDQSRNTRENATMTEALAQPRPGENWLLVTSAVHMPRAMGSFRAIGWQVVPYPVDYLSTGRENGLRFSLAAGLSALAAGLHEWQGLIYYRLRGWSDALFPAP